MLTRREFMVGGAALTAVAAGGGIGSLAWWDSATRPEDPAASWSGTRGVDRLVLAGSLAASSHNTQPWRYRVTGDGLDLLGDPNRTIGSADPQMRELHMSLGCALENVTIAAAEAGTPLTYEHVPGASAEHFARLRFTAGAPTEHSDLAAAIPRRRTNRGPFDVERPVPVATLAMLGALVGRGLRVVWLTSPADRAAFTELSVAATGAHVADATIQRDSHRWYRMSRSGAEDLCDGITVSSANLPAAAALLLGVFAPTPESFDDGWVEATRDTHCGTARAFGLIVGERDGDRGTWVAAGRAYERLQLAATMEGLATHPLSQALTLRDTEVSAGAPGRFSAGLQRLGGPGEVLLAFRIGYPTRTQPPSLRRLPVVERA